jgi:enolase
MIEGGLHAENNLRFQEHLAIPEAVSFANQIEMVKKFYAELGAELRKRFPDGEISLSDEGSYSLNFESEDMPFAIMNDLRAKLGLVGSLDFGMDAAASDVKGEPLELAAIYKKWRRLFGLIAIEDPFGEEDFDDFKKLKEEMSGVEIIGDDLTATNVELMKKANERGSVNGVIIKPNQIGTLTEALDAVRLARKYGWLVVVSHRSGETLDDWVADFAVGCGADGFKLGAPSKPERVAKYNRLLLIEREIARISANG